jgi:hypothetical protein
MSVAAARKRRAGIQPQPVGPPGSQPPGFGNAQQQPPQQGSPGGLTLQQVITVINSRLLTLETAEKERRENPNVGFVGGSEGGETLKDGEVEIPIGEILSEYAERFDFLTQELADIKEIVLKLQSYTMDVNRTLLEERLPLSFSSGSDLVVEGGNVQYEPVEATATKDLTASSSETAGLTVQTDNLPSPVIQVPPAPAPTGKSSKKSVSIVGV